MADITNIDLSILDGTTVLYKLKGRVDISNFMTINDMRKLLELEQILEKFTGYRFHFLQIDKES